MDAKTVILIVGAAIVLFVGIWVVTLVASSITLPAFTTYNESVNFAVNDTDYTLSNIPVTGVTTVYAYANNNASTYTATTQYLLTGNAVRIYANGTGEWPNVTVGTHYVTYTYQNTQSNSTWGNVSTTIWTSIQLMAIVFIVIAATAILAYFGFGRKQ